MLSGLGHDKDTCRAYASNLFSVCSLLAASTSSTRWDFLEVCLAVCAGHSAVWSWSSTSSDVSVVQQRWQPLD